MAYSNGISTLFSSLSTGNKTSSFGFPTSMLADYYSIRNGSYKKLLTAYYDKYGETGNNTKVTKKNQFTNSISADSSKVLANAKEDSKALQQSSKALLTKGSDTLFKKVTTTDAEGNKTSAYDMDKIYKGIKSFVDNYNKVIDSSDTINSSSILRSISGMVSTTKSNEKMLGDMGITINSDNTLSINEEIFKSSDALKVKSLFNTTGSYGYYIAAKASEMNYNAGQEAGKSNTYNSYGSYSPTYSSGNLYNSFF